MDFGLTNALRTFQRIIDGLFGPECDPYMIFRWDALDYLLTDNGTEFVNRDLKKALEGYGIQPVTTPLYYSQADPVERVNRTIKTMIWTYVSSDHGDWDKYLHKLRHAVKTAVQLSTGVLPAFLNYGWHPTPAKSLRLEIEIRGSKILLEVEVWKDYLQALQDLVIRFFNDQACEKSTEHYNRGRKPANFHMGDLLSRRIRVLSDNGKGLKSKLNPNLKDHL